jgi:phosphopantothenoylcysteine decarboxylase
MTNVLLGVTGSVAAVRTPELYQAMERLGYRVRVVATEAALYFFDPAALDPATPPGGPRNPDVVVLDEDEWPGRAQHHRYRREEPVLHIELRRWADLLVVAPLDANTLAKLAAGLADNCLTCVWRAWDPARPVVLAPAMNTLMWEHPLTRRHLIQVAADAGVSGAPPAGDAGALVDWVNRSCPRLRLAAPQEKRLACGDVGLGAMADVEAIAALVGRTAAQADRLPPSG